MTITFLRNWRTRTVNWGFNIISKLTERHDHDIGEDEQEVIVSLSVVENFLPIIVYKYIHNSYDHVLELIFISIRFINSILLI